MLSDLVPPAIAELPEDVRQRLRIAQQCRTEDLDRVAEVYRQMRVNVDLQPFFNDLPERMANAHLVIARAGASTIAELTVLGRPAILIPLPTATDDHQRHNARALEEAGAAELIEQSNLTGERLADRIIALARDRDRRRSMSAAARRLARPRAAEDIVDAMINVTERHQS